jgi:hypothetical protein
MSTSIHEEKTNDLLTKTLPSSLKTLSERPLEFDKVRLLLSIIYQFLVISN